jgi:hypothetical protein
MFSFLISLLLLLCYVSSISADSDLFYCLSACAALQLGLLKKVSPRCFIPGLLLHPEFRVPYWISFALAFMDLFLAHFDSLPEGHNPKRFHWTSSERRHVYGGKHLASP